MEEFLLAHLRVKVAHSGSHFLFFILEEANGKEEFKQNSPAIDVLLKRK